jgi:hypothetical protein
LLLCRSIPGNRWTRPADSGDVLAGIQVFGGHIIFRHFACGDLRNIGWFGVFDAFNRAGFKSVPLLHQLLDALRIGASNIG